LTLKNAAGLHARPCHAVVSTALQYEADLRVRCGPREANGKSILEMMTLNAACGSDLEFVAEGADAEELLCRIEELVEAGFDE